MEDFIEDLDDDIDAGGPAEDVVAGETPVGDLDALDAEDEPPQIEGIDDEDGAEDALGGIIAAPKKIKRWPLPPSLTPKKRGAARTEVALDLDVRPSADGAWRCTECVATYESRTGLFAHVRFCEGRAAAWRCEWCNCSELETAHKATGPSGIKTLCSACGQRYRHGAHGMPTQNEKGEWMCMDCGRGFPSMAALGGHRRFCDGGARRKRSRGPRCAPRARTKQTSAPSLPRGCKSHPLACLSP